MTGRRRDVVRDAKGYDERKRGINKERAELVCAGRGPKDPGVAPKEALQLPVAGELSYL